MLLHRKRFALLFIVAMHFGKQAFAQQRANLAGRVVSDSGRPVVEAQVTVIGTARIATTDPNGRFQIAIPRGSFTVRVRRIGFAPRDASFSGLSNSSTDPLVISLRRAITELRSIVVENERDAPFAATITGETVRQLPALVESDRLRTISTLPAVTQPNDIIGRIHLAGGASDEHSITLDGHPLQSPFHVNSVLGSINIAALDRAELSLHHVPSSRDGHLSGELLLETKRTDSALRNEIDVSLLSVSATTVQSIKKSVDILASVRTSYLDRLLRQISRTTGGSDDIEFPGFTDLLLRVGRKRDTKTPIEVFGYSTRDVWYQSRASDASTPRNSSGEDMIGLHLGRREGNWSFTTRSSYDRAYFRRSITVPSETQGNVDVTQRVFAAALQLQHTTERTRIDWGIDVDDRDYLHVWSGRGVKSMFRSPVPPISNAHPHQLLGGAFGELFVVASPKLNMTAGAHVSHVAGSTFLSPRATVDTKLNEHLHIAAAFDRRLQFDAIAGEPEEGSVMQPTFLLNEPRKINAGAITLEWKSNNIRSNSMVMGASVFRTNILIALSLPPTPHRTVHF